MSATDVRGYVVDLHGADRPRVGEFVIHTSAEGETETGIAGGDVNALTQNARLRTAAAVGNTSEKAAKRHQFVALTIRNGWPEQERLGVHVRAGAADAAHGH